MSLKKDKAKFILAEANIDEVNKQLRVNMFVTIVVIFVLAMNVIQFMQAKSFFYALLTALMLVMLFFISKARHILKIRKQQLTE